LIFFFLEAAQAGPQQRAMKKSNGEAAFFIVSRVSIHKTINGVSMVCTMDGQVIQGMGIGQ